MSQQNITDGETGLLTRTKLNANFSELYAQEVTIRTLSDLPAPSAGEIILPMDRWNFVNQITLPPDTTIVPDPGCLIHADTPTRGGIIGNSATQPTLLFKNGGATASSIQGGITIDNVGAGGACVRVQDSNTILLIENIRSNVAGGNLLEIDAIGELFVDLWNAFDGANGITLTNTNPRVSISRFNATGLSGDMVNIAGNMTGTLALTGIRGDCQGFGIHQLPAVALTAMSCSNCDILSQLTAVKLEGPSSLALNFQTSIFNSVLGDGLDITNGTKDITLIIADTTGFISQAIAGNALKTSTDSSDDLVNGATFSKCSFFAPLGTPLGTASKKDALLDFNDCPGIGDSIRVGCYQSTALEDNTDGAQDTWVRISIPTIECATLERNTQIANNEMQFIGSAEWSPTFNAVLAFQKSSGGSALYDFGVGVDTGSGPVVDTSSIITGVNVSNSQQTLSLLASLSLFEDDTYGVFFRRDGHTSAITFDIVNVVVK